MVQLVLTLASAVVFLLLREAPILLRARAIRARGLKKGIGVGGVRFSGVFFGGSIFSFLGKTRCIELGTPPPPSS